MSQCQCNSSSESCSGSSCTCCAGCCPKCISKDGCSQCKSRITGENKCNPSTCPRCKNKWFCECTCCPKKHAWICISILIVFITVVSCYYFGLLNITSQKLSNILPTSQRSSYRGLS
ncbi:hypothetical protein BBBOND_0108860 [Babesia bigemina]|uniref:Uncharacterized protein n=1 Tax=Babesia bigemina TaxID=5866 RepID=A0A061D1R4_BABBI|nr:hypothetical protein BBBOND_0108860 [Babesia bigemina]CDR94588.1 hypothetical protein BBBOND_0108860 [Babesia bigemina]|eukprot:XP_012766774.1 hypothetical protein BBBOND_0108860 [Babesia bigemina]